MPIVKAGTKLTNRLSIELPTNTLIKCIQSHTYTFDSGMSKRTFTPKKGETDRLGYNPLNEKYWIVVKDTKY